MANEFDEDPTKPTKPGEDDGSVDSGGDVEGGSTGTTGTGTGGSEDSGGDVEAPPTGGSQDSGGDVE